MALPHAQSGQLVNVRPLGNALSSAVSHAIVKGRDIEVMRLVLAAGKTLPDHQVPGEVTLLCLEGTAELQAHGNLQVMRTGDLVYLRGDEPHALRALEDASLLLTIFLKRDSKDGSLTGRGVGSTADQSG